MEDDGGVAEHKTTQEGSLDRCAPVPPDQPEPINVFAPPPIHDKCDGKGGSVKTISGDSLSSCSALIGEPRKKDRSLSLQVFMTSVSLSMREGDTDRHSHRTNGSSRCLLASSNMNYVRATKNTVGQRACF